MMRIHAPFDEPTLAQIDHVVKEKGISRAQWLSAAATTYLRLGDLSNGSDPETMVQDLAQLRLNYKPLDEFEALNKELESLRSNQSLLERDIAHFKDTIAQKDHQIAFLEAHVSQLTQKLALPTTEEAKKKPRWKFW